MPRTQTDKDIDIYQQLAKIQRRLDYLEGLDRSTPVGKQRNYLPASMWTPRVSGSPASIAIVETYFPVLAFDPTTPEEATLTWALPKRYDGGNIQYRFFGIQSGTNNGDVIYTLFIQSVADAAVVGAFGSADITKTMPGTDNTIVISSWSSLFGSAFIDAEESIIMSIRRRANLGGDTYPDDFQFLGLELEWTSYLSNDN